VIEFKHIPLDPELAFWTDKGQQAILAKHFQPTVVGYWKPDMAIQDEYEARHFCLAFPSPSDNQSMAGLVVHLKLQLLYNNVGAVIYIGCQKINGAVSDTALVVLGDNGEKKVCWVTPFTMHQGSDGFDFEFHDTVTCEASVFRPWDQLMPRNEDINPEMDKLIRDLHAHLLLSEEFSDKGVEVEKFFSERGSENLFPGIPTEEVFKICVTFIAARTERIAKEDTCIHT